jgi:hypothetical protein
MQHLLVQHWHKKSLGAVKSQRYKPSARQLVLVRVQKLAGSLDVR